jgi:hypothetical protein
MEIPIMAYFAELDDNNIVLRVISVSNDVLLDEQGNEVEQKGIDFCKSLLGGNWIQTSYNTFGNQHRTGKTPFRKNYAGVGFVYDAQRDAFIQPKPEGNVAFDEATCLWVWLDLPENEIGVSRV